MLRFIPFEFVFDYLPTDITVRRMFGMDYIYLHKRIMLILRERSNQPEWNGIWIATSKKYHESLKIEIPELCAFFLNRDERHGNWLIINKNGEGFEEAAIKVCEMIGRGDPRIGKLTERAPVS